MESILSCEIQALILDHRNTTFKTVKNIRHLNDKSCYRGHDLVVTGCLEILYPTCGAVRHQTVTENYSESKGFSAFDSWNKCLEIQHPLDACSHAPNLTGCNGSFTLPLEGHYKTVSTA